MSITNVGDKKIVEKISKGQAIIVDSFDGSKQSESGFYAIDFNKLSAEEMELFIKGINIDELIKDKGKWINIDPDSDGIWIKELEMSEKTKSGIRFLPTDSIPFDTKKFDEKIQKYKEEHPINISDQIAIQPIYLSKNYKCIAVVNGTKGTKIAKFIEKIGDNYRKDHYIELFFEANEICDFKVNEEINLTITK